MKIDKIEADGYENVVMANDPETGLKAVIGVVHDTTLNALGDSCMWNHTREEEAILDVLRLSKGRLYRVPAPIPVSAGERPSSSVTREETRPAPPMRSMGRFVDSSAAAISPQKM